MTPDGEIKPDTDTPVPTELEAKVERLREDVKALGKSQLYLCLAVVLLGAAILVGPLKALPKP